MRDANPNALHNYERVILVFTGPSVYNPGLDKEFIFDTSPAAQASILFRSEVQIRETYTGLSVCQVRG